MIESIIILVLSIFISIIIWFLVGHKWDNICTFFNKEHSFLDFSFIFIYFVEQVILSLAIYLKCNPQIVAAASSLIIITTASIQNKCSEIKENNIKQNYLEQEIIVSNMKSKQEEVIHENVQLHEKLQESKEIINELFHEMDKLKLNKKK